MVALLHEPLSLYVIALGAAFLLPLFHRLNPALAAAVFLAALAGMTLTAWFGFSHVLGGGGALEIKTAGLSAPFSINLRLGLYEAVCVLAVNLTGLLGGWYLLDRLREHSAALVLYLILIMGVDGTVMTRDLFNLFIFIEITSISAFILIGFERGGAALSAGFKYLIAATLASSMFLLGVIFVYHFTGTLNLDDALNYKAQLVGPLGQIALVLLLAALLVELKSYPVNGWGLDVYQNAPAGIAAVVATCISAGAFFALYKLLPLLDGFLPVIALVGGGTFLLSNFIGLTQDDSRRLLGYSSIAQMGLLTAALALLYQTGNTAALPLVVGGLFINHLLAKAGLFWLAGMVRQRRLQDWNVLADKPLLLVLFGLFLIALTGLPPFPGFWAKWELMMQLGKAGLYPWIGLILLGSLLEAAYLFRWFGHSLRRDGQPPAPVLSVSISQLLPSLLFALLLLFSGHLAAFALNAATLGLWLPLLVGAGLLVLDGLPGRVKGPLLSVALAVYTWQVLAGLSGLPYVFGLLLLVGSLVLSLGTVYRQEARPGFFPLLAVMLFSFGTLLQAQTTLGFFLAWELMTLSSYLLVCLGRDGPKQALSYLVFSLGSAFLLLGGFALAFGATGSVALNSLHAAPSTAVFILMALAFALKIGALGLHVWLPGAYSEADDDFSALLSAVVSKAGVFGLFLAAVQLQPQGQVYDGVMYALGWLGLLTALIGAMMALYQEDAKKLLAYSSMGQLGYVLTGFAIASHLGWLSAMYQAVNHLLFKGLLFLAVAGVVYRVGTRQMYQMGGLIKVMPFSFFSVMIGIIAVSGVPPLLGFGGKWLLFNALMEKGWYLQAGLAFFASAVAFLYLFRLIHTIFLGQAKTRFKDLKEAPWSLLAPQFILIAAILVFSIYPKALIGPLADVLQAHFPSSITWDGSTLKTPLGYWSGLMVMNIVGGIFIACLGLLYLLTRYVQIQPVKQFNIVFAAERPETPETTHVAYQFYAHYQRALGFMVQPHATAFWRGVAEWSHTSGGLLRVLYTGNGQTYALFIVFFLIALYFTAAI